MLFRSLVDMRSGFSRGGASEGGNFGGNNTTAIVDGRMYAVGGWEGRVSAVKAGNFRSGQRIYEMPIEPGDSRTIRNGTSDNTLCVWDDKLFFGTRQGNLYCVDAMIGKRLWKTKLSSPTRCAPSMSTVLNSENAIVYIGCDDGTLWAVDAVTGKTLWTYKTGGMIWVDAWIAEGVVYVASDDGYLYALH